MEGQLRQDATRPLLEENKQQLPLQSEKVLLKI